MSESTTTVPSIRRRGTDTALAILLIVIAAAVYLPKFAATVLIDHDDVISVIAATCNEVRYDGATQYGRWVTAADWQQYWHMQSFGCFGQIADGLVKTDIHPPLYFWLLHIWMNLFGVSIFTGLLLNLVFLAVAIIALYTTIRLFAVPHRTAFVVTLAWIVSLSTRSTMGVIRQYSLFTMLTAVLLLMTVLWLQRRKRPYLVGMVAAMVAGLLTHYQFLFPMVAIIGTGAAVLWRAHQTRDLTRLLGAAVVSGLIFVAIHPHFRQSVLTAHQQAQPFDLKVLPIRIGGAALSLTQMFNPLDWSHPIPYGWADWNRPALFVISLANVLASIAAFCFVVIVVRRFIRRRIADRGSVPTVSDVPLIAGIATVAIVVGLYISFVSPVHAIGLQYLNFATPMLFVGIACALPPRTRAVADRKPVAAALIACAAVATSLFVMHRSEVLPITTVSRADSLVLDSYRRGILPTVLWYARPTTRIYAATQEELLQRFPVLGSPADGRLLYVNSEPFGNTARNRKAILNKFHQQGYTGATKVPSGSVPLLPFGGRIYAYGRSGR